jgi:hypothetical protein
MKYLAWGLFAVLLLSLVGWDFASATTFLGDDYIFRAFARLEPSPLVAFVADKHGGEYYRPIPMLLWWVVERTSGGCVWAYASMAFLLHALCAFLLVMAGRKLGLSGKSAIFAGALFFVAPAEREAALWFSASADLLATAAVLGSVACWVSGRRWGRVASVVLAAVGVFCKETALVLPLLLAAVCWFHAKNQGRELSGRRVLGLIAPHLAVAGVYLISRLLVLHGIGGTNDPVAPWWGRGMQLGGGLVHAVTAYAPLPEWVAWLAGASILGWATIVALRRNPWAGFAIAWVIITLLPLPAAGWVVGARYYYLPAAGLVLLITMALQVTSRPAAAIALVISIGLGLLAGHRRASEVVLYRQAVAAAEAAVTDGVTRGHRLFLVRGAVKDLDLAMKLDSRFSPAIQSVVVIPDVPASFIWLPPDLARRLDFLFARPALPPSGAYRFGHERILGLARRDEAPDLDEVLVRLPELRMIQIRRDGGHFTWQDLTDGLRSAEQE